MTQQGRSKSNSDWMEGPTICSTEPQKDSRIGSIKSLMR
jgi:hypothetical protein